MSRISTVVDSITAPGRGDLSLVRLEDHLQATVKRLKRLGVRPGDCIASLLPEGPDTITLALAVAAIPDARFVPLVSSSPCESLLLKIHPKLLVMHPGDHPAREIAHTLGISVVNVLRHFEAGVFTLEAAARLPRAGEVPPLCSKWPAPKWKNRGVPLVLIAPGTAYRRLANRLDAQNPVIGLTPPSLELMSPPHTIEHIAAECVRMLRRYRPHGPYALAGWRTESLVALEMARLLEEEGERVAFVALLDASSLFLPPVSHVRRALDSLRALFAKRYKPSCDFVAEALRQYRPHPWYGKILHIRVKGETSERHAWFEWRDIAPHGLAQFQARGELFSEANVETLAGILASELDQTPRETAPGIET